MKEYQNHLNRVLRMNNNGNDKSYEADSYPWGDEIRKFHPLNEWGSIEKAEKYLQQYWLNEKEYLSKWQPLQEK